jgi:hypothetical protein
MPHIQDNSHGQNSNQPDFLITQERDANAPLPCGDGEYQYLTPDQRAILVADILSDIALRLIKKQSSHETSYLSSPNC